MFFKTKFLSLILILQFILSPVVFAENAIEGISDTVQAVETTQESKYPDYSKMYVGDDKFEKMNRKVFNLNTKLNKYIARPVHILWSSIIPRYGIDRIRDVYNNIEYPKRLASCILQRDGQGIKIETVRFLTNSTLGLGGLFDPADKLFGIKSTNENMEQALGKCKCHPGSYLVVPCLNSCTPRSLCGRALEAALDPSVYIATPISSLIKFGLMLNKTSYMQPIAKMIESTYADPYDIHKKLFGMENFIRNSNFDRVDLISKELESVTQKESLSNEYLISDSISQTKLDLLTGAASPIESFHEDLSDILPLGKNALKADIILDGYNKQTPVVDSMRTAFFEKPEVNKSMWNELSIWNRSFAKRIKKDKLEITPERAQYEYHYIMQKDKNSPIVIIYPSIGEGAGTNHSIAFAKIFYDEGYSVVMQGSHFQWEFVKSMPEGYYPGLPNKDSEQIRLITLRILDKLQNKYGCVFKEKTLFGTSFGAMTTLFIADKESKDNKLGASQFIAVSPPIELSYALKELDKNSDEFDKNSPDVKEKTAKTVAKILQMFEYKNSVKDFNVEALPFSEEEGKLITTFILRQKLSDLMFSLKNTPNNKKTDFYENINNFSYQDYAEKYLGLNSKDESVMNNETSLFSLSEYLANNDNYRIYESFDDYFINEEQIKKLKDITGNNLICLDCGSHLGFLYRKEFEDSLKSLIKKKSVDEQHLLPEHSSSITENDVSIIEEG